MLHGDPYERPLKTLLERCQMPCQKTHKGEKMIILVGGIPIGGARLIKDESRQYGLVASVCIEEEFRGTGAGRFLMNAVKDLADHMGMSCLYLGAVDSAVGFYEKLGYESIALAECPDDFQKPLTKITEEYQRDEYPYRIAQYMKLEL